MLTAIFTAVAAAAAAVSAGLVRWQTKKTLQVQALLQLEQRWWSDQMCRTRKKAATALLAKNYTSSVGQVLDFFETLAGLFVKDKVLSEDWAHHTFYWSAVCYWQKSRDVDVIQSVARSPSEKRAWEDVDKMMPKWIDYEVKHGGEAPTNQDVDDFLQEELEL